MICFYRLLENLCSRDISPSPKMPKNCKAVQFIINNIRKINYTCIFFSGFLTEEYVHFQSDRDLLHPVQKYQENNEERIMNYFVLLFKIDIMIF